ncbi:MAG: prepilin-type N-terminal cleavage/methylation domain-containing protein [Clostridiaceae bacterium]
MKKLKSKKGFSLMELLVVIAISGILMAISAPKYQGMIDKAEEVQQKTYIREALNYVDVYNLDATDIPEITLLNAAATTINSVDLDTLMLKIEYDNKSISALRLFVEKGTKP